MISEAFQKCFFRTSAESLDKHQSMMALFEFPEHIPEKFLASYTRVRANDVIIMMNRGGLWQGITG